MRGYGKLVRDLLEPAGCTFLRHGRGDHDPWTSSASPRPFTVPVNMDSPHTANAILKDAGLPKAF